MAAVLFSHWIGLHHSIKHAGWQQRALMSQTGIDHDTGSAHHSCAAFDAATLVDSASAPLHCNRC
jgi:hypothetical protein